jgi:MSHA biogenesis protein MshM
LRVAGFVGDTLFDMAAVAKLHRVTRGTPRLVNIIANKSLMLAFGEGRQHVSAKHIAAAAADTPEARRDWLPLVLKLAAGVLFLVSVIAWMVLR